MQVANNSNQTIWVSINRWGSSGDPSFYQINQGSTEPWDRSDSRGFVMFLAYNRSGSTYTGYKYYIYEDSSIAVTSDQAAYGGLKVTDDGRQIQPD